MRKDIGIAFSGGGIKTLCQPALISYLEDHKIRPVALSGTSAGAMIAALMAMGLSSEAVFEEIKGALVEIEQRKILRISGRELLFNKKVKHGFIDGHRMSTLVQEICDRLGFHHLSEVKIPLALTAVDLYTGTLVVFVSHPHLYNNTHRRTEVISDISLAQAITASMSFPMVFGSVEFEDYALIDGGVRMNTPVPMLKDYGAKKTLAITIRGPIDSDIPLNKSLEVISRVYDLLSREAEYRHSSKADYVFNVPVIVDNIFDLQAADKIYNQGLDQIEKERADLEAFFKRNWWQSMKELL